MRNALPIALVVVLVVLSLLCGGTAFAITLEPTNAAIRFDVQENERCLTRETMPEDALQLLGVDEQTAQQIMERDQSVLMVLSQNSAPLNLLILDAPDGIAARDVSELDATGRERLLLALGRKHDAQTAAWQGALPDYALCESTVENTITMHTLSLDTLYLGKIYSLRVEIIGRDVNDSDRDALRSAAMRMLRLGAVSPADARVELQTPTMPALSSESAEAIVENGGVPLTLESLPVLSASNTLSLKGVTDPKAKVRYQVNDRASSAFSPGKDGSFSVLAKGLKNGKDNRIMVTAKIGKQQTTHSFIVKVEWQDTPLMLSQVSGIIDADSVLIHGATLPGSDVKIDKGGTAVSAIADENGFFSFILNTRKKGNYVFSVQSTYAGFRSTEIVGKIRKDSADAAQKAIVNYQKLLSSPNRFAGKTVSYVCTVTALDYENGQPKCLVDAGEGQLFVLLCGSLQGMQEGQSIKVSGTLTGALGAFGQAQYPTLMLDALIN